MEALETTASRLFIVAISLMISRSEPCPLRRSIAYLGVALSPLFLFGSFERSEPRLLHVLVAGLVPLLSLLHPFELRVLLLIKLPLRLRLLWLVVAFGILQDLGHFVVGGRRSAAAQS